MCFDVPKVVRSPGYDHGHDEESRNGRDIKIDILDGYIWTPERFWRSLEPREVTGTPREVYGPYWALVEERGKKQRRGRAPPSPIQIGRGVGPPFLPPSFLFLPSPTPNRKKGESYSRWEVGSPLGRATLLGRPRPPLLYIRGQEGTP